MTAIKANPALERLVSGERVTDPLLCVIRTEDSEVCCLGGVWTTSVLAGRTKNSWPRVLNSPSPFLASAPLHSAKF